jgi:AcrR family transcriptional regulator
MGRPLKTEARDTRREILDAALDLFSSGGYFGTSTRHIAKEVGVRESALYHYFASKEAILTAMVRELGLDKINRVSQINLSAMLDALGHKELLKQMFTVLMAEWSSDRERKIVRLMLSEGPRLAQAGLADPSALFAETRVQIEKLVTELQKRGAVRADLDTRAVTLSLIGPLMVMRVMYIALPAGPVDLKAIMADLDRHLEFFWKVVG